MEDVNFRGSWGKVLQELLHYFLQFFLMPISSFLKFKSSSSPPSLSSSSGAQIEHSSRIQMVSHSKTTLDIPGLGQDNISKEHISEQPSLPQSPLGPLANKLQSTPKYKPPLQSWQNISQIPVEDHSTKYLTNTPQNCYALPCLVFWVNLARPN